MNVSSGCFGNICHGEFLLSGCMQSRFSFPWLLDHWTCMQPRPTNKLYGFANGVIPSRNGRCSGVARLWSGNSMLVNFVKRTGLILTSTWRPGKIGKAGGELLGPANWKPHRSLSAIYRCILIDPASPVVYSPMKEVSCEIRPGDRQDHPSVPAWSWNGDANSASCLVEPAPQILTNFINQTHNPCYRYHTKPPTQKSKP